MNVFKKLSNVIINIANEFKKIKTDYVLKNNYFDLKFHSTTTYSETVLDNAGLLYANTKVPCTGFVSISGKANTNKQLKLITIIDNHYMYQCTFGTGTIGLTAPIVYNCRIYLYGTDHITDRVITFYSI